MAEKLASRVRCEERIQGSWQEFLAKRSQRLVQQDRNGVAAEKVAENILEDLFTMVLDWPLSDLNNQVEYADMVLTSHGIKHLVIEVKRPGALTWNRRAVGAALDQARRYADEQKVKSIAVSDGQMLYAADVAGGVLRDRVYASLCGAEPPQSLWWLSVHGIYRDPTEESGICLALPETTADTEALRDTFGGTPLLHSKYQIPACCFAYVGNAGNPATWKLPYRKADGTVDFNRLPKAIQCILSNYRGAKVRDIPESAIPEVLVLLARAAADEGKLPHQTPAPAGVYIKLMEALDQLGRLSEIQHGR